MGGEPAADRHPFDSGGGLAATAAPSPSGIVFLPVFLSPIRMLQFYLCDGISTGIIFVGGDEKSPHGRGDERKNTNHFS